ncbi:Transcriptional regulator, GntR family [Devosia sp. LC5]|uniref:FadR/GntR family transcriptional regulator n=1 Tax=Devosia sp. LC5 TaxID=1502724 RepID=UPI0004E3D211|nr:FadR/GntR family transcriptional regulator [Devosia sp. LC5]KFC69714.1 Transcriptional regulator, GntR family [Devosia sp. LC5]
MIEPGSLIRSLSGRSAARNFHTFVINEIGHGIVTGKFPVGSILASDAVMMETYGVSRTVLREALKTLEAKGLVEARPKVGTRVSPASRWSFFDPQVLFWHFEARPEQRFYESLFDVREALESRAAELASHRRTADEIRILKYWAHQMDIAEDGVEPHLLAALEIHRAIAESSGNALLRSVTGVVELTMVLAAKFAPSDGLRQRHTDSIAQHEALVSAMERGDSNAAVQLMQSIITRDKQQTMAVFG